MPPHEPIVSPSTPLPKGYTYIRRGNIYITKTARRLTHQARSTVYIVHNERNRVQGIRVPTRIWKRVRALNAQTRGERAAKVARTDACLRRKVEREVRRLFPRMPEGDVQRVLGHALKKRSGRVGRKGGIDVGKRVDLAVRAHVRHVHTGYERMLREGVGRDEARRGAQGSVDEKVKEWGGKVREVAFGLGRRQGKRLNGKRKASVREANGQGHGKAVGGKGSAADPIALSDESEEFIEDEESSEGSSEEYLSDIECLSDEEDLV